MKGLYKFATAFLAFVILLPFESIRAAAYDDCDVNHDGYIDVSDAVLTSQYLSGLLYVSDYNRFDTNKSLTVDNADVKKIMSKIVSYTYNAKYWNRNWNCAISFPSVSGFTPDIYASSSEYRKYRRYSYLTGQELPSYDLTPIAATLNSETHSTISRGIIGNDNRVYSLGEENSGIVHISIEDSNGTTYTGTGFIVGDHIIATAAHNVYKRYHSGGYFYPNTPTIMTYNINGTMSNTELHPVEVHVPREYGYSGTNTLAEPYDYALISVSDNLSNYTQFSLGTSYNVSAENYSTIPLYLLGPGMVVNEVETMVVNEVETEDLYYSQGNIVSDTSATSPALLYYNCDSLHGDSGAPVYTITKVETGGYTYYYYTALAIHTRNDLNINNSPIWNAGVRITKYQLQFFNEHANANISYETNP